MVVDYPGALDYIITDPRWVFTDALKNVSGNDLSIVNHKTASPGQVSAIAIANFFKNDTNNFKSAHFVIDRDGTIVQVVKLKDGAGANCCLEVTHDTYWDYFQNKFGNLNTCTIAIEHVDQSLDNSQPMTSQQIDASKKLNLWLCQKLNIPVSHIKTHDSLDPKSKARCPGPTFPLQDIMRYVSDSLNSGGVALAELKNFPVLSQRTPITSDKNYSEDMEFVCTGANLGMCMLYFQHKTNWDTSTDLSTYPINPDQLKDEAIGQGVVGGSGAASAYVNTCKARGFHIYEVRAANNTDLCHAIHATLQSGRPCILNIPSIYDPTGQWSHVHSAFKEVPGGFAAVDPYPLPSGTVITKSDADWIKLLQFNSIWVVEPLGGVVMPLPTGAKDDGTKITFSNGKIIEKGFRTEYLKLSAANRIPSDDTALTNEYGVTPVEQSNPGWWQGAGTALETRYFRFGYTPAKGVHTTFIGQELRWYIDNFTKQQAALDAVGLQLQAAQAEIDALKAGLSHNPEDVAKITALETAVNTALETVQPVLDAFKDLIAE